MAHHQQCRSNHSSASSIPEPCPKRRTGTSADSDMVADSNDEDNPPATEATDPDNTQSSKAQYLTDEQELVSSEGTESAQKCCHCDVPPQLSNQLKNTNVKCLRVKVSLAAQHTIPLPQISQSMWQGA
ncbi:hypothetical protein KEM48_003956 [Puccinia striiformis f. sp. tritici PST-130]|nr:hypothetical protein KEM48_003956 [Puccinia striiformis f. sp. tritici PST-130]